MSFLIKREDDYDVHLKAGANLGPHGHQEKKTAVKGKKENKDNEKKQNNYGACILMSAYMVDYVSNNFLTTKCTV